MKQIALTSILSSVFFICSLCLAETIELPNQVGKIELKNGTNGAVVIVIHGSIFSNTTKVDSVIVENPARAVFDFVPPVSKLKPSLKFAIKENSLFNNLRIGTSGERTRFVLDFIDLKSKGYKISHTQQANDTVITVTGDAPLVVTPTATETPAVIVSPTPTKTPEATITPTPTLIPTPTAPSITKNGMSSIIFDLTSNSLQIEFVNPVNYKLTRNSSESYLLLLEGAMPLKIESMLEQFPQQGILGFQAISPKVVNKGIQIELFLEQDYQPEASWNKNILVIKAKSRS